MTQEEIIEGNKLIAEFMGYQILHKKFQYQEFNSSNESYFEWNEGDIVCDENGDEVNLYRDSDPLFNLEDLPFDESWDWLMPVVEKIESLGFWTKILAHTTFDNKYKSCDIKKIKPKSDGDYIYNYEGDWHDSKIEAVWLAVVEFIKFYNSQENKKP